MARIWARPADKQQLVAKGINIVARPKTITILSQWNPRTGKISLAPGKKIGGLPGDDAQPSRDDTYISPPKGYTDRQKVAYHKKMTDYHKKKATAAQKAAAKHSQLSDRHSLAAARLRK